MQYRLVVVALFCVACRFVISPLDPAPRTSRRDLAPAADLAPSPPPDLAVAARADLAAPSVVHDLAVDPCADAPALAAGNLAAQCVAGNAPVVDGNLAEWSGAAFVSLRRRDAAIAGGSWSGDDATDDGDASLRLALRWDLANLYVAVAVRDDIRDDDHQLAIDALDALELYLDGQHDRSVSFGDDDWRLVLGTAGEAAAFRDSASVTWPAGATHAVASQGADYTLEVAIPWSRLGGGAARVGRLVGFDARLDDNDGDATLDRWLTLAYATPAGGSCSDPRCRTDVFGTVQLAGR